MEEKEFELYAKNKFMEIVGELKKLHPEYDYFEINLFPNSKRVCIKYREGNVSHEISFDLKEEE